MNIYTMKIYEFKNDKLEYIGKTQVQASNRVKAYKNTLNYFKKKYPSKIFDAIPEL